MQESGAGTDPSMNGASDVMQVNNGVSNFADYVDYKAHYGLNNHTVPDPATSINAGVKDIATKGFHGQPMEVDKNGNISSLKFGGWDNAIKNINGGGAVKYEQDYLQAILNMIQNAKKPDSSNY